MVDIDYIMNLIDWEKSPEDQRAGIELAKQVECINVFLRPCSKKYNKNVWENCAVILADREDSQLLPYLIELFSWLQDLNWPGALCVYERLAQFTDSSSFEHAVSICVKYARAIEDVNWLNTLKALQSQRSSLTR